MDVATYEERFGAFRRRFRRGWRAIRWSVKGACGQARDILVETRWRLGDEIMALPIYEALRQRYPGSRVWALCNHADLLIDNPHVHAINEIPASLDRYILLRSAPRMVYRLEHYARLAGVPMPVARPQLHYRDWKAPQLSFLPERFVAVSCGASWATKRWPLERWRALCRDIEAQGYGVVELGQGIERIGVGTSLVDTTTVREAACVLRAARLFIGCDSGLMHLALAAGTPALALFGPTAPAILVRDEPRLHAIASGDPCQGCWNASEDETQPGVCPLHRSACLDSITVEAVRDRAYALLAERK